MLTWSADAFPGGRGSDPNGIRNAGRAVLTVVEGFSDFLLTEFCGELSELVVNVAVFRAYSSAGNLCGARRMLIFLERFLRFESATARAVGQSSSHNFGLSHAIQ